jgi:large subunit ribosomal protein L17
MAFIEVEKLIIRTMATQLVEHERIRTTHTKAKALRPMVEKIIALGKVNTINA